MRTHTFTAKCSKCWDGFHAADEPDEPDPAWKCPCCGWSDTRD